MIRLLYLCGLNPKGNKPKQRRERTKVCEWVFDSLVQPSATPVSLRTLRRELPTLGRGREKGDERGDERRQERRRRRRCFVHERRDDDDDDTDSETASESDEPRKERKSI